MRVSSALPVWPSIPIDGSGLTDSASNGPCASNDGMLAIGYTFWRVVNNRHALIERRVLDLRAAGVSEIGRRAVHRHAYRNLERGIVCNFSNFSDDLTELTMNARGAFINLVARF